MATKNQSPCLTCTRVKNPSNCENKACQVWQSWFLRWWKGMQEYVGIDILQDQTEGEDK